MFKEIHVYKKFKNQRLILSKYGMSYRVELVIKFPIDWHSNLETLFFDHFLQKKCDVTPYEKIKN